MAAILTVDYWLVKKRAYHVYVSPIAFPMSPAEVFAFAVPSFTTLAVSVCRAPLVLPALCRLPSLSHRPLRGRFQLARGRHLRRLHRS